MTRPISFVRTIITSVIEGVIKRFTGSGRHGESFTDREYFQHYGFTSRPLQGAEGILLIENNKIYLIASDDRRYRITLEEGEVALYTDEGDKIHLKRDKEIHISTGNKLTIDATNEVVINTENATVNCSEKAKILTQDGIELDGGTDSLKGFVQGDCICLVTGQPHFNVSQNVKGSY